MGFRICLRLGLVAGAAVGLMINLLSTPVCCAGQSLSLAQQALYGMLVALIVMIIAAAFTVLVSRRPTGAIIAVALTVGVIDGALLGPVAYALPHPSIAMFVCGVLGALLALALCWLLCRLRFMERAG